jgi:hypothetical protein
MTSFMKAKLQTVTLYIDPEPPHKFFSVRLSNLHEINLKKIYICIFNLVFHFLFS